MIKVSISLLQALLIRVGAIFFFAMPTSHYNESLFLAKDTFTRISMLFGPNLIVASSWSQTKDLIWRDIDSFTCLHK